MKLVTFHLHFHSTNKLPLNVYHPALQTDVAAERGKLLHFKCPFLHLHTTAFTLHPWQVTLNSTQKHSIWTIRVNGHQFKLLHVKHHNLNNSTPLTLILPMWRIWWAPNKASRWQMGFNLAFKGLISTTRSLYFKTYIWRSNPVLPVDLTVNVTSTVPNYI